MKIRGRWIQGTFDYSLSYEEKERLEGEGVEFELLPQTEPEKPWIVIPAPGPSSGFPGGRVLAFKEFSEAREIAEIVASWGLHSDGIAIKRSQQGELIEVEVLGQQTR
jgi:hypothetical protein